MTVVVDLLDSVIDLRSRLMALNQRDTFTASVVHFFKSPYVQYCSMKYVSVSFPFYFLCTYLIRRFIWRYARVRQQATHVFCGWHPPPPKQQLTVNWDRYAEVYDVNDIQGSNCVVAERFPMSFVIFLSEIANAHNLLPSIWQTHQ